MRREGQGVEHPRSAANPAQKFSSATMPSSGCRWRANIVPQVLQCMRNRSLVFFGDSMVRQLFNRLVYLFRGQVCRTAAIVNQTLSCRRAVHSDTAFVGSAATTDDEAGSLLPLSIA